MRNAAISWHLLIESLADLVTPERFKRVLRHYHKQAKGDHTHLCRLIEPASQPGIQSISAQAA